MKILGIDIGEKRIGIAISDRDERLSVPFSVIENDRNFISGLEKIISEHCIKRIIIGMPYTLKGTIGEQGLKVIDFVKEKINFEGVEIIYFDERFTSSIVENEIKNRGLKKKQIDKMSAAIILQDYLDRKNETKKDQ